jgi:hypothetical protein
MRRMRDEEMRQTWRLSPMFCLTAVVH